MKLHLGCRRIKKKGYINCDISSAVKPDKIVNLEKKLPFKNNSVDEIIANHVLEHIIRLYPLMEEFQRICKNKAIIKIKVPYFSSESAFFIMTHIRFSTSFTMDYFCDSYYSYEVAELVNPIINLNHNVYCKFFVGIFPCSEIYYELEVIKKNEK